MMKTVKFNISHNSQNIVGDRTADMKDVNLFMLHGAGQSDRTRFTPLRQALYERGKSSLSFDFSGHGETGGMLTNSSLKDRTDQAVKVISTFSHGPISLVGNSMSGYTAVKLTTIFDVKNLVLIVPAAYDRDAYELNFTSEFSNCIRRPFSYRDSDSWEILEKFKGNLLVVAGEKDEVIPVEVIERVMSSSANSRFRNLITVKDAPHGIMNYMKDNPTVMDEVTCAIVEMLQNKDS